MIKGNPTQAKGGKMGGLMHDVKPSKKPPGRNGILYERNRVYNSRNRRAS